MQLAAHISLSSSVVASSSVVNPSNTLLSARAWTAFFGQSMRGSIFLARLFGMAMPRSFTRTWPR